jgi:hypothetical protein
VNLMATVLTDISDDSLVLTHKSPESALARLVKEYDTYSKRIERLPDMTATSTGKDLKTAILSMAPEDQIKLAYHYYLACGTLEDDEAAEKEDRKLKHFVVKVIVSVAASMVLLLVGGALVYTHRCTAAGEGSEPVINGFLSTAAEIAKILLSFGD